MLFIALKLLLVWNSLAEIASIQALDMDFECLKQPLQQHHFLIFVAELDNLLGCFVIVLAHSFDARDN